MNAVIIEQFNRLVDQIRAEYLNAQVDNDVKEMKMHEYRLQSVKKISGILKRLDYEITDIKDVEGIPGIGEGTRRRIKEILETGRLSELKGKYNKKKQAAIDSIQELENVIGIGSKTAKKLVTRYKIKSVEQLKKAVKEDKIQVAEIIRLGLKYYGVVKGAIPRKEVQDIEKYLIKQAHKIDPLLDLIICGSYRRGKKTSGDVDVLIYHPEAVSGKHLIRPELYNLKPYMILLINELTKQKFLLDHITDDKYQIKYMGFCKYKNNPVRRIDIRMIPYKSLPTAMLYFTGPYELNQVMRSAAKKRNMLLNEYGLYTLGEEEIRTPLKIESEKDVFEILGMKYLTPEERENFSVGKNKF